MFFKQITYQVTYLDNGDGLSSSCFQSLFLCWSLFAPSPCALTSCAATAMCGGGVVGRIRRLICLRNNLTENSYM